MSTIAKAGDFFAIPLSPDFWGCGVVALERKKELYLVIFEETFESLDGLNKVNIEELTPFFSSSSLDAKIWNDHWPVIGKGLNVSALEQPIYKVEEGGRLIAESFDGKRRFLIGEHEAANIPYRKVVAPVRLENALKAHHGLINWNPIYDELRYFLVQSANRSLIKSG